VPVTTAGAPTAPEGTSGDGQVTVSWTTPASNGGAAITDYVVQYSTSSSSGFSTFSDGTSTATSATVTGLSNNTPYYFKVAAVNSAGTGTYSSVTSSVTPRSVAPVISSTSNGNGSLTFTWGAISHGGDNYRMYWGTDSTFATGYSYTGTTLTTYTVTGLTNGTTYYFRVAGWNNAVNPQVDTTDWSTTASGIPGAAAAPTSLVVSSGRSGLSATWTAPASNGGSALTDYIIQYTTTSGSSYTTFSDGTSTETSATITGLTAGTTYYVRVAAVNSLVTGTYSAEHSGVLSKTCANGGVCAVGDTGPGGGIIFLTPSSDGNSTGYWFEAALGTWFSGSDTNQSWCSNNNLAIGSSAQGTALGTGQGNTTAIVAVCTSGAAYQAKNYTGGGKSDWFLPSQVELQKMYAAKATIGGFTTLTQCCGGAPGTTTDSYWSSSEATSPYTPATQAIPVNFGNGGGDNYGKIYGFNVRPIRMFNS